MPRTRRKAEHQQHVGTVLGDELRQLGIDGGVAGAEHVSDEVDARERRASSPREALHQRFGRIERRAGERSEPGDQHGQWPAVALRRASVRIRGTGTIARLHG